MSKGKIALFWDESFLWGLLAYQAFSTLPIDFDIVTSAEINKGILDSYDLLFVPGGWARDKSNALGIEGRERIQSFIRKGGGYIGVCGGAGLALASSEGLALVPAIRKPSGERMPNFSGRIKIIPSNAKHPIWEGLSEPVSFHAWWPGQFSLNHNEDITIIAVYGKPEAGFFVSDLAVEDIENYCGVWNKWEKRYGISLNPDKLEGEPAIIEAGYGKGKVFLSYLHLDTPDDNQGNRALFNICGHLVKRQGEKVRADQPGGHLLPLRLLHAGIDHKVVELARDLEAAAEKLIAFGERNFLWYRRNPWMLQWRRGIRGFEYGMVYKMLKWLSIMTAEMKKTGGKSPNLQSDIGETLTKKMLFLKDICFSFFEEAKQLLMKERYAMNDGLLNLGKNNNYEIQRLRTKLFSSSRRWGGDFRQVLDTLDEILLLMARCERSVD